MAAILYITDLFMVHMKSYGSDWVIIPVSSVIINILRKVSRSKQYSVLLGKRHNCLHKMQPTAVATWWRTFIAIPIKALRGAGFGCLICCGAVQAAGQISAVGAGLRAPAGWYPLGGPNDVVAGRERAQLFQRAQFHSTFAHCLCLLIGGLPGSSLCVWHCLRVCDEYMLCMRACVHTSVRATRCRA